MEFLISGLIALFIVVPITGLVVGITLYRALSRRMEDINARAENHPWTPSGNQSDRAHRDNQERTHGG